MERKEIIDLYNKEFAHRKKSIKTGAVCFFENDEAYDSGFINGMRFILNAMTYESFKSNPPFPCLTGNEICDIVEENKKEK